MAPDMKQLGVPVITTYVIYGCEPDSEEREGREYVRFMLQAATPEDACAAFGGRVPEGWTLRAEPTWSAPHKDVERVCRLIEGELLLMQIANIQHAQQQAAMADAERRRREFDGRPRRT